MERAFRVLVFEGGGGRCSRRLVGRVKWERSVERSGCTACFLLFVFVLAFVAVRQEQQRKGLCGRERRQASYCVLIRQVMRVVQF